MKALLRTARTVDRSPLVPPCLPPSCPLCLQPFQEFMSNFFGEGWSSMVPSGWSLPSFDWSKLGEFGARFRRLPPAAAASLHGSLFPLPLFAS